MSARLTRERVVAAALGIVDREGLDALTMRALGRTLGVDPMAVYHHLPNKAAILDAVAEAVIAEVPADPDAGLPWPEQVAALARGYRAALRRHPNALPAVATRPDVSVAALRLLDVALGVALRAGFAPAAALELVHATSCLVVGHALDESGAGATTPEVAALQAALLATGEYPNLAAVATVQPGDTFETGLAALVAGFEARLRR